MEIYRVYYFMLYIRYILKTIISTNWIFLTTKEKKTTNCDIYINEDKGKF